MIVLPSISQNVFIIDSTRYTCYNNFENREIAKLLLSEEYCQLKINNVTFQNYALNNTIDELRSIKDKQDITITSLYKVNDKLSKNNKDNINKIMQLEQDRKLYRQVIIGSVALNLILILVII